MTPTKDKNPKDQIAAFREKARELGCDDDEERFDHALKRIAKAPSSKPEPPRKAAKPNP
jgi:hypothetical protein